MARTKVIIEVSGGVVQAVYGNVDYILVDFDNIDAGDPVPNIDDPAEWSVGYTLSAGGKLVKDAAKNQPEELAAQVELDAAYAKRAP